MTPREDDMELAKQPAQPQQSPSSNHDNGSTNTVAVTTYHWVGWTALSRHEKYDLIGWVLFVASATFYTVAAVEFKSRTSLLGSLVFLAACFIFMIPLLRKPKQS